jgi:hypothetical protein
MKKRKTIKKPIEVPQEKKITEAEPTSENEGISSFKHSEVFNKPGQLSSRAKRFVK